MKKILFLYFFLLHISSVLAIERKFVEVNLHGVNYSENAFRFYVINFKNPSLDDGGELIDPFSAGGISCCATLPKEWRPGTKLAVRTIHWLKERPDGTRPEIREVHQVELPRYESGKTSELWILRAPDGKVSAVASELQPNHPNWPGHIRGWPRASIEHRREKWTISKRHEEDGVNAATELLEELERAPSIAARKIWETEKEYDPRSVVGYSGPGDPRYLLAVKKRIRVGLNESKQRLRKIIEARP